MQRDCDNCKHAETPAFFEPCASCGGSSYWEPIVKTNADRIRAMTDEELAEFLIQDGDCPPERMYPDSCPNCDRVTLKVCYDCWHDWLNQEADKKETEV